MAQVGVVECNITISGDRFPRVPNSVTINLGYPTNSAKSAALGGGAVETVIFTNIESKVGKVKFDSYATKESQNLYQKKRLQQVHDVQVSQLYSDGTRVAYSFPSMVFTNSPDFEESYEGKFSIEMEGSPAVK